MLPVYHDSTEAQEPQEPRSSDASFGHATSGPPDPTRPTHSVKWMDRVTDAALRFFFVDPKWSYNFSRLIEAPQVVVSEMGIGQEHVKTIRKPRCPWDDLSPTDQDFFHCLETPNQGLFGAGSG